MNSKLTPLGKITILVVVAAVAFFGWRMFGDKVKSMLGGETTASVVPKQVNLPALTVSAGEGTNLQLNTITETPSGNNGTPMRMLLWAWNAQSGLMLANGGAKTTQGSLMEQLGVNLQLTRQDDPSKMQEALIAFAQELKNGNPQPTSGAHYVAIMGDGAAAFLKPINDQLRKLGPEYTAKVIGSAGYSRGEDKFMGPAEWKNNPSLAKGGVVSGYLRDGDWNIALKWLGDNNIKNNPDERTWDPDALNWVAANDYIDASEKYIAGYSEERPVVRNGKRTGETKRITVQGVVTWTPGDVIVAEKKGGLVSIVSTREYSAQMPNTIIGIDKWMKDNRKDVENMLSGIFAGGDAIKSSDAALQKASQISANVYNESGADAIARQPGPNMDSVSVTLPPPAAKPADEFVMPKKREDGSWDFSPIYAHSNLQPPAFTAEQARDIISSLPESLPLEVRRETVSKTIGAIGKTLGITPDVIASDAALKIVAVEDFRGKIKQRFDEYEVKAQQAIAEYEKKIAETRLSIESAKSRSADVMSACDMEIDKLDDVTEFFTLDTGSSKHVAPATEPEKVGV